MTAGILVAAGTLALLAWWFRFACTLILTAKTSRNFAGEVAEANHLQFAEIEAQLAASGPPAPLEFIECLIHRDYEIVLGLLRHTGGSLPLEGRILRFDYRLLRFFNFTFRFAPAVRTSLMAERCRIVGYLANTMGERSLPGAQA